MKYDDLDIMAAQLLLIMGALILGILLGSRTTRGLPPPDSNAQRNKVSYL